MKAEAPGALVWFVAGFGIWAVCFALLYGLQAVGCEWGWHEATVGPATVQAIVLAVILAGHLAVLAILSAVAWRWWSEATDGAASRFLRGSAAVLTAAALAATLWTGLPAVLLPACI